MALGLVKITREIKPAVPPTKKNPKSRYKQCRYILPLLIRGFFSFHNEISINVAKNFKLCDAHFATQVTTIFYVRDFVGGNEMFIGWKKDGTMCQ